MTYLKGVGPHRAVALQESLNIYTWEDLLLCFPRKYMDRSRLHTVATLQEEGEAVTLTGRLGAFETQGTGPGKKRLTSTLDDGTGTALLTWFQGTQWIQRRFKPGDEVVLFGRVSFFQNQAQLVHPEIDPLRDEEHAVLNHLKIVPFYPGSDALKQAGLDSRQLRRLVHAVLEAAPGLPPEFIPAPLTAQYQLLPREQALQQVHFPQDRALLRAARRRLKFEEFFLLDLVMFSRRQLRRLQRPAPAFPHIGQLFNTFYENHLPFQLTQAQKRVIKEVRADLALPIQMNRLVQGDVGSGKTLVALMCALIALDNGYQVALMAPTEILAEQHFRSFSHLLAPLGVRCQLLTGSVKARARKPLLAELLDGSCHILIGTHALIEDSVQFARLGLTIIDEQHKFGVAQRTRLWQKNQALAPHNLAMTATPIPRTLAMTVYGDVDISVIDELPPGRKPITTTMRGDPHRLRVYGFLREELEKGRQAYVVYPLVEQSAKTDLLAVTHGWEALSQYFTDYRVGIVHGRMSPEDKEGQMRDFKERRSHILVSTTVIEVGVDVPNASVMIIENAERFGLSQLHQLRGRVGRGAEQSYCILMSGKWPATRDAQQRLKAMCEHQDGFRIAELDLELRGPGDFLGTRQSGLPEFRIADVVMDADILGEAREAARQLAIQDPDLQQPEHQALQQHLNRYIRQNGLAELRL
ncbi:MAG: ATP-dependent DNA helicase RecG [Bacteroidetes bacterium]|nr:ATP-dependent DNA helicase RecG [Bacteroidota bacterium]